jgi:hypothetical protein
MQRENLKIPQFTKRWNRIYFLRHEVKKKDFENFRHVLIVAKIAYYLHARPSDRMYLRGSYWTDFREIFYWGLL